MPTASASGELRYGMPVLSLCRALSLPGRGGRRSATTNPLVNLPEWRVGNQTHFARRWERTETVLSHPSKRGTVLRLTVGTQDQFIPCTAALGTRLDTVLNKVDAAIGQGGVDSSYVLTA